MGKQQLLRINSTGVVCLVVFVPPLLGVDPSFFAVCIVGALGPDYEVIPAAGSSFSSSGFASLGKSGASGGTNVADEVETIESGGKMLAKVSSMSGALGIEASIKAFPSLSYLSL